MQGIIEEKDAQPVAPRAHKKSKRGCRTCKTRKIKCDETHPLCNNCRIYFQGRQIRCEYEEASVPASPTRPAPARKKRKAKGKEKVVVPQNIVPEDKDLDVEELGVIDPALTAASPFATAISPQKLDPFQTHPPTPEIDADQLLQHYFQTQIYAMFPFYPTATINPQSAFYTPLIYTDPLLYHVTLQLSALHLEKVQGSRERKQSKRLMAECLRLLRERVEGSGPSSALATSDETIASVAGLVGIEHDRGNVRMVQLHMSGLARMLELRGGLNAIRRTNGMIANLVFCTWAAAHDLPFPSSDLESPWPKPPWFKSAASSFPSPVRTPLTSVGVPPEYAAVLQDIRILAASYQGGADCEDDSHYMSVLVYLCATLQRGMSLPNTHPLSSPQYWISEGVRSALILHVFRMWCGKYQPDPSLLVSNARQNLKSALRTLHRPGSKANAVLLWFAAVGGASSEVGCTERKCFVGHTRVLVEELGISTWERFRRMLRGVVWHESQDGTEFKAVWDEVREIF